MTLLDLEINVSNGNAVAVIDREYPGEGRESGQTIAKQQIIECQTTPCMTTYYYKGENLVAYCQKHFNADTVRVWLYSRDGFDARMRIKREIEAKIEKRSLWLCCCTCGLILCRFCCCCPGRHWEMDVGKLNDEYYCERLRAEAPDRTQDVPYTFGKHGDPMVH